MIMQLRASTVKICAIFKGRKKAQTSITVRRHAGLASPLRENCTVDDVIRECDLSHKTYAVTGAEAGLGFATAKALIGAGATVLMGCQNLEYGQKVAEHLNTLHHGESRAVCQVALDLGDRESIRDWSTSVTEHGKLDGLVHHACLMGLGVYLLSKDGEEMQWSTNYLGPFRLTQCLWETLTRDSSKVICLSSISHGKPCVPLSFDNLPWQGLSAETYNGWGQYQQSKLATILWSRELNRRFRAAGSGARSYAACELDNWFIMERLKLPQDKEMLAKCGPATSVASLVHDSLQDAAYIVNCQLATPSEHATDDEAALRLWEYSMRHL
eukprot:gnl/MRDRNA2_/MRDRNA2_77195_c0_seq1.p1 gnl/MRDRNA2_/MRDRNA2_77195_c0~~gnl/MRDRNA2_/MRDRNA2_77195_c0_seq1.p1  ORF type:complete len:327 (-),score=42.50 gnl/MRDRNA2_/MRDRNA2_77195_c0_seq1:129-1109(-)